MSPEQVRGAHRRPSLGHLLLRRRPLRDAHRAARLPRADSAVGDAERDPQGGPAADHEWRARTCRRRWSGSSSHCLEKNPDERFQSARDLAFDIEALSCPSAPAAPTAPRTGRARAAVWAAAAFLAGGLIAGIGLQSVTTTAPGGTTRFTVPMPPGVKFGDSMTLSRDGRTLVYSGIDETGSRRDRRALDTLESVAIRGTEGGNYPFPSPDGTAVGFAAGLDLKRVPLQGGSPVTLSETVAARRRCLAVRRHHRVPFGRRGLMRVPAASGGETRPVHGS